MGVPAQHYWTAAEVQALPAEGNRYEVVYGEELVSSNPPGRLCRALHRRPRITGTHNGVRSG